MNKKPQNMENPELLRNYVKYERELKWLKAKVKEFKKEIKARGL